MFFHSLRRGGTRIFKRYFMKHTLLTLLLLTTIHAQEVINGHVLPPEPDPVKNNATLLGIDVNHNGVRDDVERWIYKTYKDKHPIHIDIAMQAARASRKILEKPLMNNSQAKEIHKIRIAPMACEAYYMIYAKYFNKPLLVTKRIEPSEQPKEFI